MMDLIFGLYPHTTLKKNVNSFPATKELKAHFLYLKIKYVLFNSLKVILNADLFYKDTQDWKYNTQNQSAYYCLEF